eukprot:3704910-Amphidinium_carterae.1
MFQPKSSPKKRCSRLISYGTSRATKDEEKVKPAAQNRDGTGHVPNCSSWQAFPVMRLNANTTKPKPATIVSAGLPFEYPAMRGTPSVQTKRNHSEASDPEVSNPHKRK